MICRNGALWKSPRRVFRRRAWHSESECGKEFVVAKEYKVVALSECPLPEDMQECDTPDKAARYWDLHVKGHPHFNPEVECCVILLLNSRHKVKGHQLVSVGTLNETYVHPREVFRTAVVASAAAIVVMRAGELLKIEVLDHVIVGAAGKHASLRSLGYLYPS